jgi:hypothetical protein
MKKGLLLIGLAAICFTFCGCSSPPTLSKTEKIDNIQAVFLNRPHDYTIYTQKDNQLIPRTIYSHDGQFSHPPVKIFLDVSPKDAIWAEIRYYSEGKRTMKIEADIHIHSKNDIQGGQWREKHGKGPEHVGSVNKIE